MEHLVTRSLAEHIATFDCASLPPEVVDKTRWCLLDSIGCIIGGTGVDEVRVPVDFVLGWGGHPEAAVPGLSDRYPAPVAAYAAAQLASGLDYDDTVLTVGHPGAAIIATALALGQQHGSSGDDLIRALVAGYEAAIRVGRGIAPSLERARTVRGHSWAVYGAVAAAASLLRLNADQTAYAFGFAAQHAPVPFVGKWYERPITALKNNYGWAAMGGIIAATVAARGGRGLREVLDGPTGFWAMASSDQWDTEVALAGLGTDYTVLDVAFKPFAACRYTHATLDALQTLIREHALDAASVQKVTVRAAKLVTVFADYEPGTLLGAQYSLPYAIASLLLGRPLTSFDADDQELAALARRVEIEVDPEAERRASYGKLPAEIVVELTDGRRLEGQQDIALGDPSRSISAADLRVKFMEISSPVVGGKQAEALYRMIRDEPRLPSAQELADQFAVPKVAASFTL